MFCFKTNTSAIFMGTGEETENRWWKGNFQIFFLKFECSKILPGIFWLRRYPFYRIMLGGFEVQTSKDSPTACHSLSDWGFVSGTINLMYLTIAESKFGHKRTI